jgi:uncharacterized lipoprotein YddW (UPF0748 family)
VYQPYSQRTTAQNKAYLRQLLDELHTVGINVVIFQVRTRGDAFYRSELEPWSAYLTGTVGKAPSPYWDPLQFMIDECHSRGMELHAWLNPYRGPATADKLPASHLLNKAPARFLKYGKSYYYDPSQPKNRELICQVVRDIITRYDVDGIHFDDYFYPYPIAGEKFPDAQAYAKAKSKLSLADWRRANVDALIHDVYTTIQSVKPWLRFGISPFGIWRNAKTDPRGSETSGLQNYDDLYADVPSWAEKGWIDYQMVDARGPRPPYLHRTRRGKNRQSQRTHRKISSRCSSSRRNSRPLLVVCRQHFSTCRPSEPQSLRNACPGAGIHLEKRRARRRTNIGEI